MSWLDKSGSDDTRRPRWPFTHFPRTVALCSVATETTLLHCTSTPRARQGFDTSNQDMTVTQCKPPSIDLPGRRKDAIATAVVLSSSIYISSTNMLTNKSISELSISGMSTRIERGRLVFAFCAPALQAARRSGVGMIDRSASFAFHFLSFPSHILT